MEFPDAGHDLVTETGTVEHAEMTDLVLQIVRLHRWRNTACQPGLDVPAAGANPTLNPRRA
jgi:hypothetical protein